MYNESDRKLREMLKNATVAVDETLEQKPNAVDLIDQQQGVYRSMFEQTIEAIKAEDVAANEIDSKLPAPDPIAVKWKCSQCSSVFETRYQLRIHRKCHLMKQSTSKTLSPNTPTHCTICFDKFPSQRMLDDHKKTKHPKEHTGRKFFANPIDGYECDICSKRFNSRNKIRQHLVTHINEGRRKFLCVACGNQFCSKFGLTQHISAIHDKEQRFECTKCNRRFAHKHNLKTHLNRHNGIRPYKCTCCDKTFYDSSTLNVHTKSVHSGTNAYICSICSKGFNRNGNLKIHMVKTHHIQHPKMQNSVPRVIKKVE